MDPDRVAALTAELTWLRRLARALVGDRGDDVAHDAWLVGVAQAPADGRPLRPWLARVTRNLVRMEARADGRRSRREDYAADAAEPALDPDALVARAQAQRALVDAVLALDEPYRSTVLLHYFEELPSAAIARRLGIPDGTVRRRLKEALDRLRARLGSDERGRLRVLAPLLVPLGRGAGVPATAGSIIMTKLALLIALVVVVLIVWRWQIGSKGADIDRDVATGARPAWDRTGAPTQRDRADVPAWFAVRGVGPHTIAGRVTLDGAPVPNALVALNDPLTRAGVRPALQLRTRSDGTFDFGSQLPCAYYEVTANAPGAIAAIAHTNSSDPGARPTSDHLELRLRSCTTSIAGTVQDAGGTPIAHAHALREGLVGVDADDRGEYRLCVPRGAEQITYEAEGYGSVALTIDSQGETRQDVVLVPEATVSGRVVADSDGHPLAGALVRAKAWRDTPERPADTSTLTDRDGRFQLAGLAPDRYNVDAVGDGAMADSVAVVAKVGGASEVVLHAVAQARIVGRITSRGEPVAGAHLAAVRANPHHYSEGAASQPDGSFVIEHVPLGDVTFTAAPYRLLSPEHVKVAGDTSVALEVAPLATVRGRVTRHGLPVADADVCCITTIAGGGDMISSEGDGTFEFRGVRAGHYVLAATSHDLGAFVEATAIDVVDDDKTIDLELDLAATISGTVVDQDDHPVPGVLVRWRHEQTGDLGKCITDVAGNYRCSAMTGGGSYHVSVYPSSDQPPFPAATGHPYASAKLENGTSSIDGVRIAIDRQSLAISGHVVDSAGNAVADALVEVQPAAVGATPVFDVWRKRPSTFSDGDGSFTISGLTEGHYAVHARTGDGGEGTSGDVAAGTTTAAVAVARPGAISGVLVGFAAPPFVDLSQVDNAPNRAHADMTDAASFTLGGLRPGRYVIGAQTFQDGDAEIVDVRAGETTPVTMRARGSAGIDIRVLDFRTRKPVAGQACHVTVAAGGLTNISNWDWRTVPATDANGRTTLDKVPSGAVQVLCHDPTVATSAPSADIILPLGGHGSVELLAVTAWRLWPTAVGISFDWRTATPRIAVLDPGGAGESAGLLVGDVVIAVDGASVAGLNGDGVSWLLWDHDSGTPIRVGVSRGGIAMTFTVVGQPPKYQ